MNGPSLSLQGAWQQASQSAALVLSGLGQQLLFSALLCLVVWFLTRFVVRRHPGLCHGLWALVLLRLVLPVDWSLAWSARGLVAQSGLFAWVGGWFAAPAAPVAKAAPARLQEVGLGGSDAIFATAPQPGWALWALALWMVVAMAVLLRLAQRRRSYLRLARRARPIREARLAQLLEIWRQRLGIRRAVRLVSSPEPVSPFTFGVLRPVVYLPSSLLRHSDPEVVEAALAHELAHVARFDDLWLRLGHLVQALYFFHPVAWLAGRRMHDERERICDRQVISRGPLSGAAYGRGLLAVIQLNLEAPAFASAFAKPRGHHGMRIRDILDRRSMSPGRPFLTFALVALLGLFLLPMAGEVVAADAPTTVAAADLNLINPLPDAKVTAGFGMRTEPFEGTRKHHRGIDLAAPLGTPVRAARAGKVVVATETYSGGADHGTVVVLDHGDGLETFYSHLQALHVAEGQEVSGGQQIATAGNSGKSTGPHLHFEVRKGGKAVNPAAFVTDWRLKPSHSQKAAPSEKGPESSSEERFVPAHLRAADDSAVYRWLVNGRVLPQSAEDENC